VSASRSTHGVRKKPMLLAALSATRRAFLPGRLGRNSLTASCRLPVVRGPFAPLRASYRLYCLVAAREKTTLRDDRLMEIATMRGVGGSAKSVVTARFGTDRGTAVVNTLSQQTGVPWLAILSLRLLFLTAFSLTRLPINHGVHQRNCGERVLYPRWVIIHVEEKMLCHVPC